MSQRLPDDLAARLEALRPAGSGWVARCPVHDDHNPSLSLTVTDDGRVLAKCHAGCDQDAVVDALGLREQRRDDGEWTPHGPAVAIYDYRDERGELLFQVLRTADKQFPQRRPDPLAKSGWRWSLGDTRRVLFRLPELIAAVDAGQTVYVTEGEKDALALVAHGKAATCNPGGAGKWRREYAEHFRGAKVIVCADKDEPGQAHARTVAAELREVDALVWVIEAADPHKDIAAHLGAGLPLSAVNTTVSPEEPAKVDLAPDIHEFLAAPDPDYDWLVGGMLERGERLMITGFEGLGKSMLIRQLAVCLSAGLHPFTIARGSFAPVRVLVLDCENSERQNRRKYRRMVWAAQSERCPVPAGGLRVIHRPEGIDLAGRDDSAWLLERVTAHRPDVLFVGPLYRLHRASMNDEPAARAVVDVLDEARVAANCALVIEAHSGHGDPNERGAKRSVRPTGSSLFLRWPEFGYGLVPVDVRNPAGPVRFQPWRGPRDERAWPEYLERVPTGFPWGEWYPDGGAPFIESAPDEEPVPEQMELR